MINQEKCHWQYNFHFQEEILWGSVYEFNDLNFFSLLYWYQEPMQWFLTKQFLKGCNLGEKLFLTTMTMINLYYHRHGKKRCKKKQHFFSLKTLQVKGEESAQCHHWLHRLGRYRQVSILLQNCSIDGKVQWKINRTLLSCWHHTLRERWGRNFTLSYACIFHSKANLWQ